MASRTKQVIINDLMAELNKFGGHITNIQKAIESKGVTSAGKLFNFPEEIRNIESANRYRYLIDTYNKALKKGYTEDEIIGTLNSLKDKNLPKPEPQPDPNFDPATATEIPAKQFYGRSDLEGELTCPKVVKVGAEAFIGTEYSIVNLPLATDIDEDAFAISSIKVLNIPSFVWKDNNLNLYDLYNNKYGPNKIIVADESVPPSGIAVNKVDLEVYNHDSSKKWDVYANQWKAV